MAIQIRFYVYKSWRSRWEGTLSCVYIFVSWNRIWFISYVCNPKVTYTSRGEDNYHPANIRKWMPKHCLQGEEVGLEFFLKNIASLLSFSPAHRYSLLRILQYLTWLFPPLDGCWLLPLQARRVLDSAGLAVLVLQMISAYLAVSLLFSLPLAENIFA